MTSTPAQFAIKMSKLSGDMRTAPRQITIRAAGVVKRSVQTQLAVAAPRGRLNVGKRGARIGVRYDLRGDSEAVVRMTGPAHLIERDTKPHRIPRENRGRGRSRARNVRRLAIPGVGIRMSVQHPGTKGKRPWEKGVRAALPDVEKVAGRYYFDTVRKAIK
jgi:hypothetical protein